MSAAPVAVRVAAGGVSWHHPAMVLWLFACTPGPVAVPSDDDAIPVDTAAVDTGDPVEVIESSTCAPGAAPVFVTEGELATFTVSCTGDGTATGFTLTALPDGATFSGATFSWTPGPDAAGHYVLTVGSIGDAPGSGTVELWVADAWGDPANQPVDPRTYEEEFGLPVFHLDVPGSTNADADVDTTLVYRGRPWALGVKYRGSASSYYPKRSYTLSFPADDEFRDDEEDFGKRHKIVLTTLFDDNAYLRQMLCYELWNALEPERQQLQTYLAVVYINGVYEGLYLVSDHIDGEWWEDYGYDEDGSLYKSVTHQANFYDNYSGAPKSTWHDGYEKQEGALDDWADLDELVAFVAQSDDATFAAHIEDYVVIDEIADWWILVRYTEADDSGGKNAYLYVDPTTGIIHHAPWDFNHAFGQTWQTEREASDTNYDFFWSNNLFKRLLENPVYAEVLTARMQAALAGPLDADAVIARIDAHLERAEPSAERDWAKWQEQYRGYGGWYWREDWTSHDEEIAYVKRWVRERHGYMTEWYP